MKAPLQREYMSAPVVFLGHCSAIHCKSTSACKCSLQQKRSHRGAKRGATEESREEPQRVKGGATEEPREEPQRSQGRSHRGVKRGATEATEGRVNVGGQRQVCVPVSASEMCM